MKFIQLNAENVCVGIVETTVDVSGIIHDSNGIFVANMILLDEINEEFIGQRYNNGQWEMTT